MEHTPRKAQSKTTEAAHGAARALFEASRIGVLGTLDAKLRPHLVPIVFALCGSELVSAIDDKTKAPVEPKRIENINVHPYVSVLVEHYDEDWSALCWARADGSARVLDPHLAKARQAIEQLRARYCQYETVSIRGPVIVVAVDKWSYWHA